MKKEEFCRRLAAITPDMPQSFSVRVDCTLESILQQPHSKKARPAPKASVAFGRRVLVFALIATLLCSIAFAAVQWGIFDTLGFLFGSRLSDSNAQMQQIMHRETVNNVEITVREAMYDGRTLFIQYSYRMLDEKEPLGILDANSRLQDGLTLEAMEKLQKHNVGWWTDRFWIDGQCIDMAEGSGAIAAGTLTPGEIVITEYWRLDRLDIQLNGKVSIALPIGESQAPGTFTADLQPDKGMVTFDFDAGRMKDQLITLTPFSEPDLAVQVKEAAFSPLMTYITLTLADDPDALAAYKAENGEGGYDSSGKLAWEYTMLDVYQNYISSLTLVDGKGEILFPQHWGLSSMGDDTAEFCYPHIAPEKMPDTLWLAPASGDHIDMSKAIRVK